MTSTRLPGKSLADVGGEPLISLLVKRLRHAETLGAIVLATSSDSSDDAIEAAAAPLGLPVVRGPRDDVLARFLLAVEPHDDAIVRITADCPLIDPAVVDGVVRLFQSDPTCRYAHNVEPRTYPDGLDVEVVDTGALLETAAEATDPADREHVTPAIRRDAERFPARVLEHQPSLGALRWTVDYPDDLEFVREVVARLGNRRYEARLDEVLAVVRAAPSLAAFAGVRG